MDRLRIISRGSIPKVTGLEGSIGGGLGFPLTLAPLGMEKKGGKGLGSWGLKRSQRAHDDQEALKPLSFFPSTRRVVKVG